MAVNRIISVIVSKYPLHNTINADFLLALVWSNFEIADMDFWRGPAYTEFFQFLDSKGGFYYEVRS